MSENCWNSWHFLWPTLKIIILGFEWQEIYCQYVCRGVQYDRRAFIKLDIRQIVIAQFLFVHYISKTLFSLAARCHSGIYVTPRMSPCRCCWWWRCCLNANIGGFFFDNPEMIQNRIYEIRLNFWRLQPMRSRCHKHLLLVQLSYAAETKLFVVKRSFLSAQYLKYNQAIWWYGKHTIYNKIRLEVKKPHIIVQYLKPTRYVTPTYVQQLIQGSIL